MVWFSKTNNYIFIQILLLVHCVFAWSASIPNAPSATTIDYDLPLYNTKQWVVGDDITFTLPLSATVSGKVNSVQLFDGVHYFIEGSVKSIGGNGADGWFSASYFEDSMNANINYDGNIQLELRPAKINKSTDPNKKTYTMRYADISSEYDAREVDLDTEEAPTASSASLSLAKKSVFSSVTSFLQRTFTPQNNNKISTKNIQLESTAYLKILVLYTKQAVTTAGSESSLQATILLAVGNFNNANVNSQVDISVSYVAERIQEYDTYVEDASMSVMLNQLSGGTISTARRYAVGAHAVQLVTANTQYCGLAGYNFYGQTNGNSASYHGCIGGYLSLAHEVGHSIGAHHDLSVYASAGPNHGSCWDVSTSTTACRRSVMAYASCKTPTGRTNCVRVQFWSSPTVYDSNRVVGDTTSCNNAQQLRNNIARFTSMYTMSPVTTPTVAVVYPPSFSPTAKPIFPPTAQPIPPSFQTNPVAPSPTSSPSRVPTRVPTTVPTTAVVGSTPVAIYNYLGCYADTSTRAMTLRLSGSFPSIASCFNAALAANYKYFAMQYGTECWVSNDYTSTTQYGACGTVTQCACTMTCADGDFCGNGMTNSLYEIVTITTGGVVVPSPTQVPTRSPTVSTAGTMYTYLGCYADSSTRAMTKRFSGKFASIEACFNSAAADNYKYFGLQYGGECWVSNDYAATTRYGACGTLKACACSMKCSNGDICGAGMTNSLYRNDNAPDSIGSSDGGSVLSPTKNSTMSGALIAVIVVSIVAFFVLVGIVILFRNRKQQKEILSRKRSKKGGKKLSRQENYSGNYSSSSGSASSGDREQHINEGITNRVGRSNTDSGVLINPREKQRSKGLTREPTYTIHQDDDEEDDDDDESYHDGQPLSPSAAGHHHTTMSPNYPASRKTFKLSPPNPNSNLYSLNKSNNNSNPGSPSSRSNPSATVGAVFESVKGVFTGQKDPTTPSTKDYLPLNQR